MANGPKNKKNGKPPPWFLSWETPKTTQAISLEVKRMEEAQKKH